MSLESRLKHLERAAAESKYTSVECIAVATVMGNLQIPISLLPAIEKIYGNKSGVMPDDAR